MTEDAASTISAAWAQDRPYLLAVASRILADPTEAEDVVQDAFARLAVQRIEEIRDLRAWLVVVVRRRALDRLGAAHRRLSVPLRDDSGVAAPDPADRVTLDDDVRRAFGVVLDRLSPAERTAFLLHDVFGLPFDAVGELVGRTPAACRQLASRARRAIRERDEAEPVAGDAVARAVVARFAAACEGGDLAALMSLLDPSVEGDATLDGRRVGFNAGIRPVAETVLSFLGPRRGLTLELVPLEHGVGLLASRRGEPHVVLRLDVAEGLVHHLHAVVLPG